MDDMKVDLGLIQMGCPSNVIECKLMEVVGGKDSGDPLL
jgi:hypothetical protein